MPRGRPPKKPTQLQIVEKPAATPAPSVAVAEKLDRLLNGEPGYPKAEVNVLPVAEDRSTGFSMPVMYLPWADTLPRTDLQEALIREDSTRALLFYEALSDPKRGDVPISVLAQQCGIRTRELIEIWRHHKQVEAIGIAITGSPEVARHTVEDAKSITICCTRCDGAGVVRVLRELGPEWIQCITCKGTGAVRRAGDAKSREWVLRAAGVIKADGSGVVINQNFSRADSVLDELDRCAAVDTVAIPEDDA